eukprot:1187845-Prorocentrum_minimum.AAC.6
MRGKQALKISGKEASDLYLGNKALEVSSTIGSSASAKVLFLDPNTALGNVAQVASVFGEGMDTPMKPALKPTSEGKMK